MPNLLRTYKMNNNDIMDMPFDGYITAGAVSTDVVISQTIMIKDKIFDDANHNISTTPASNTFFTIASIPAGESQVTLNMIMAGSKIKVTGGDCEIQVWNI